MKTLAGATCALALVAGAAFAEPAIIFDLGGKFDKSFNEAAFNGATRWAEETGGTYLPLNDQVAIDLPRLLPNHGEEFLVDERLRTLWDRDWVLYLLVGLLSVEWLTRKLLKLA